MAAMPAILLLSLFDLYTNLGDLDGDKRQTYFSTICFKELNPWATKLVKCNDIGQKHMPTWVLVIDLYHTFVPSYINKKKNTLLLPRKLQ